MILGQMLIDEQKIDEVVLALLYLTLHDECRAWKSFDWNSMNRLHEKGFIADPIGKAKSVVFTERGLAVIDVRTEVGSHFATTFARVPKRLLGRRQTPRVRRAGGVRRLERRLRSRGCVLARRRGYFVGNEMRLEYERRAREDSRTRMDRPSIFWRHDYCVTSIRIVTVARTSMVPDSTGVGTRA
jgi:hypothetical protein